VAFVALALELAAPLGGEEVLELIDWSILILEC
jgi:hypothetical protein